MRTDQPDDAPARVPDVHDAPASRQPPDSSDALDATATAEDSGARDRPEAPAPDTDAEREARIARVRDHRATVDAAYRAYAIDQAYEKIREIERGTVTPAMKRIEAGDPDATWLAWRTDSKARTGWPRRSPSTCSRKGLPSIKRLPT